MLVARSEKESNSMGVRTDTSLAGMDLLCRNKTRMRGPFWSIAPAPILLWAAVATKLLAIVVAVYGCGFMVPIGWKWAALIWVYALAWFVVNDCFKLAAYRILDPLKPAVLATAGTRRQTP